MIQQLISKLNQLQSQISQTDETKSFIQELKLNILKDEKDLNVLTDHLSEGYFQGEVITDTHGMPIDYRLLAVNKKFKSHSGLETQNILGKTILEIFPDIEKFWIQFYGEVGLTQKSNSITHYNHNTKKHYLVSAFSLKKGEFSVLFQDITSDVELNLKNEENNASLKLNAEILDNMGDGFLQGSVIYDQHRNPYDIRILQTNKAFQTHTGIDETAVIDKTFLELFPSIDRFWLDTVIEVAITQVPKSIIDYGKITKKHYSLNAFSPLKDQVIIIIKDISELEKEKLKLKESESLKSKIIEHMMDGFIHSEIICDENNEPIDYRILDVNPAFIKHTKIKREDIVGKTMLEFYPDIEESWIKLVGKVGLTQEPIKTTQYNHNTKKHYEINAYSPVKGQVVKIFRDVTQKENERIQLEKAYKKAEENERLKSAFLANMSHEIRTPMNGILGCAALLEKESLGKEERNKCLDYIKSSGNRLMRLISDIVDLSKIDAFEQELRYADHNLNEIMDSILHQFKVSYSIPKIKFSLEKGMLQDSFVIKTDEVRLTQVLTNLLENAFKFTEEGSITFGYHLEKNQLLFFVKDTGIGIKPKDQKLIFRRFGQVLDDKTKMNQGTGLGTSIAKGFVGLFGGKIWLESEFGKGSVFYFSIPYIPPRQN